MVALIIWVVFAVSCGALAHHKCRDVAGWSAAGFAFGFIALIVLCFRPSLATEDDRSPSASGTGASVPSYDDWRNAA